MQLHTLHHVHSGAAAINAVCGCVFMHTHSHVSHAAMIDLSPKRQRKRYFCRSVVWVEMATGTSSTFRIIPYC